MRTPGGWTAYAVAVTAVLVLAGGCSDGPAGPGDSGADAAHAADTAIVREILDLNGLPTVAVATVAGGTSSRITYLNLSGRNLVALTNRIARLDSLSELYLSNNRLSSLPDSIVRLTRLTILTVGHNRLCSVPAQIAAWITLYVTVPGWESTQECATLAGDTLVVRGILDTNGLVSVPASEVIDTSHERVAALNLAHRGLTLLPAEVGELDRLRTLDLHDNHLTDLPLSLLLLDSLTTVLLDYNQLCDLDTALSEWADGVAAPWRELQACSTAVVQDWAVLLSGQNGDPADTVVEQSGGWLVMGTGADSLVIDSITVSADTSLPPQRLTFRPVGVPAYASSSAQLCTLRTDGTSYGEPGGSPRMRLGPSVCAYLVDFSLQPCLECSTQADVPAVRIGDSLGLSLVLSYRRIAADSSTAFRDTLWVGGAVDGEAFADRTPVVSGFMDFTTSTWQDERIDFSLLDSCKEFTPMRQDTAYDLYFGGDTLRSPRGIKRLGSVPYRAGYWYCDDLGEVRAILDTLGWAVSQADFAPKAAFSPGGVYLVACPDSTQTLLVSIGLVTGGNSRMQFVWGMYAK